MRTFIIHQNRFTGAFAFFRFPLSLFFFVLTGVKTRMRLTMLGLTQCVHYPNVNANITQHIWLESNASVRHEHSRQALRIMSFSASVCLFFVSFANSLSLVIHWVKASAKFCDNVVMFNSSANANDEELNHRHSICVTPILLQRGTASFAAKSSDFLCDFMDILIRWSVIGRYVSPVYLIISSSIYTYAFCFRFSLYNRRLVFRSRNILHLECVPKLSLSGNRSRQLCAEQWKTNVQIENGKWKMRTVLLSTSENCSK